ASDSQSSRVSASNGLTVLAGSEVKDLQPLMPDIERHTGLHLNFKYVGSLDGAQEIASGTSGAQLAWFSHSHYVQLLAAQHSQSLPQESIMRSPVVMGVKMSVAHKFGWDKPGAHVTWKEIATRAGAGELHFGMTNPTSSNSGFSALIGVAAAFAGSADALDSG